ncbi:hypothetical protein [Nitrosomonas sp. Nm166]|uniref:hypothetical protein n=1 Tax=Nitrosomonas sp. Nm166 TaxID=1881054 RepID=UPI0008EDDC6C|nr:hypothetical protein [Nitrosomonas sp. Nm166]SFE58183.1 hypothetical protein SAMN05428977_102122 [Nitrosomonas sp. Nm166]
MKKLLKKVVIASILSLAISNAMATSNTTVPGQWTVQFYLEPGLTTGASQGICFKADGTWFSTTFGGWEGDWFKKGDRLRWYGDTGIIATAEFGQFSSKSLMTGEFAHFFVPGTPPVTSTRGNYKMTKVSSTCDPAAASLSSGNSSDPASKE